MFKTLYTTLAKRERVILLSDKPTKTIQEPKTMCDINNIVDLYCRSGRAADLLTIQPFEGIDCAAIPDNYMDCLEYVNEVQADFDSLPSAIRKEVGNTPLGMLQWISNPANKERGVELGIFEKSITDSVLPSGDMVVTPEHLDIPLEPKPSLEG